jgi:hypothetical protein
MLGWHVESLKEWDQAIALDAGPGRPELRACRALTLAALHDHVRAAAEANELARDREPPAEQLYLLARVYGRCARVAPGANKPDPQERQMLAGEYGGRSQGLLVRAQQAGFFKDPASLARLRTDADLDALRARPDFQKWLAEVEKAQKK